MRESNYVIAETALLVIDPYNDFMSEGGKLHDAIKGVAQKYNVFENMRDILRNVRTAGISVFVVPHHRAHGGDYEHWRVMSPMQKTAHSLQAFAVGSWGGEWHPDFGPQAGDVVIREHWATSGFANTDLDEQLKQHGIKKLVIIGMTANTCLESTARYGMEMGYHVTLVRDATAAFNDDEMHAAHDVNGPMFAHAILTTSELLPLLPQPAS